MKNTCEQLNQELQDLEKKKKEFDLELEKAVRTRDFERAKELKQELEKNRDTLKKVFSVIETQDKKQIISGSGDRTIKVWGIKK